MLVQNIEYGEEDRKIDPKGAEIQATDAAATHCVKDAIGKEGEGRGVRGL